MSLKWDGNEIRIVVFAWGKSYIDNLMERALSAALAPGNIPTLAREFNCTLAVVTEEALFDYVREHQTIQRIEHYCKLRLIALDDLIAEPWQYGITLANALFRGFSELGSAMTETYILFLNADFILADGSYASLIPYIRSGHRAIVSPSYCANEEAVLPILSAKFCPKDKCIALAPRDMANLILMNRHNTILAKTVSQSEFHFRYSDQFYWEVDQDTLISHQMPIALVAMRPEVELQEISTFWDWGVTYDFCPSKNLTALGDSDEFLMLELRSHDTHRELILAGQADSLVQAESMSGYITEYQIDNSKYPLTLHSGELPIDIDKYRLFLANRVKDVTQKIKVKQSHHKHSQWAYHQAQLLYFQETLLQRREIDDLKREVAEIDNLTRRSEFKLAVARLSYLNKKQLSGRRLLVWKQDSLAYKKIAAWLVFNIRTVYAYLFKRFPSSALHATWPVYRDYISLIYQLSLKLGDRALLTFTIPSNIAIKLPSHFQSVQALVSVKKLAQFDSDLNSDQKEIFDYCFLEMNYEEHQHFETRLLRLFDFTRPGGMVVIHIVNSYYRHNINWIANLYARTLLLDVGRPLLAIGGQSRLSRNIANLGLRLIRRGTSSPIKALTSAAVLLFLSPFAYIGNLLEQRKQSMVSNISFNAKSTGCSMTIQISKLRNGSPNSA